MTPREICFSRLSSEPTFVLTGDQDWAPDWALERTLALARSRDVPFHLFVTNPSELLTGSEAVGLTLGIHPNFLPGSTHGESYEAVLNTCHAMVPDATTFRCHAYAESTHILRQLVARGFSADSNLVAFLQPGLMPIVHGTGLIRLPVFLEDDVLLSWIDGRLDLSDARRYLFTPGLKILNFHPSLVGLNAPDLDYYNARRDALFDNRRSDPLLEYNGYGIATALCDVIDAVRDAGCEFTSLPELVGRAYEELPRGLYAWPGRDSPARS